MSNQFLSLLLGWVRGLAASLWAVVTGEGAGTLMAWLGEHWLALTLVICAVGLAADLVVYLIRWQPYRVYRSFFRRRSMRKDRLAQAEAPAAEAADVSDSGRHRRVEKPRKSAPAWVGRMTERLSAQEDTGTLLRRRRVDTGIQRQEHYNEPYYPPQYRQPGDTGTITQRRRRRRGGGAE